MAGDNFSAPTAADNEDVTDITLSLSNLPITAEVGGLLSEADNPVVIPLTVTTLDPCGRGGLEVEVVSGKGEDRKLWWPMDMSSSRLESLKLGIELDSVGPAVDQSSGSMSGEAPSGLNRVVILGDVRLRVDKIGASGS